jgi:ribose-phosphate pyrophosphokinase
LNLIQGECSWNAASVNVVIPYLSYSTMERAKPHSTEIPKKVTRTRQIVRARPDCVTLIDLHFAVVLQAHAGEVSPFHAWTESLATEQIKTCGFSDYILVSPDYGFSKRMARFASILGYPHTVMYKDRYDADKTIVGQVSSMVRGRRPSSAMI